MDNTPPPSPTSGSESSCEACKANPRRPCNIRACYPELDLCNNKHHVVAKALVSQLPPTPPPEEDDRMQVASETEVGVDIGTHTRSESDGSESETNVEEEEKSPFEGVKLDVGNPLRREDLNPADIDELLHLLDNLALLSLGLEFDQMWNVVGKLVRWRAVRVGTMIEGTLSEEEEECMESIRKKRQDLIEAEEKADFRIISGWNGDTKIRATKQNNTETAEPETMLTYLGPVASSINGIRRLVRQKVVKGWVGNEFPHLQAKTQNGGGSSRDNNQKKDIKLKRKRELLGEIIKPSDLENLRIFNPTEEMFASQNSPQTEDNTTESNFLNAKQ